MLQGRVQAAHIRRWSAVLACSAARAFSLSLLDRHPVHGTGADIPSVHEVLRDAHFSWGLVECLLLCNSLDRLFPHIQHFSPLPKKKNASLLLCTIWQLHFRMRSPISPTFLTASKRHGGGSWRRVDGHTNSGEQTREGAHDWQVDRSKTASSPTRVPTVAWCFLIADLALYCHPNRGWQVLFFLDNIRDTPFNQPTHPTQGCRNFTQDLTVFERGDHSPENRGPTCPVGCRLGSAFRSPMPRSQWEGSA